MTKRKATSSRFQHLRNIGIIAHVDAGKTTLTERLLSASGAIHRAGSVDDGTTATDSDPIERQRRITINAAAVHFEWDGCYINLIDTPGHADFTMEVERSLRVLDGAVVLLDAVSGVEPQTEQVWRQADRFGVARICFVNKMDRPGADLGACLVDIRSRFGIEPILIDDRRALVERCADIDDDVATAFLRGDSVPSDRIDTIVAQETAAGRWLPTLSGSAAKNIGVHALLDATTRLLPCPRPVAGSVAFCFKVVFPRYGQLSFVRVYGGSLRVGELVHNDRLGKPIRIGRLVQIFGERLTDVDVLDEGNIGAIVGGDFRTGDTLHEPGRPIGVAGIEAPKPVVFLSFEPHRQSDRGRLDTALGQMLIEDPSLTRTVDPQTSQELIGGVGRLHLEVAIARLEARAKVKLRTGKPSVAHWYTIGQRAERTYRHVKRTGGPGQFAVVAMTFEPMVRGHGVSFEDRTRGGCVPTNMVSGVEAGAREALSRGVNGTPFTDVHVTLVDGETHSHDSSEFAFKIAAAQASKEVLATIDRVLLEPMVEAVVTTPASTVGAVVGDLERRRGTLTGLTSEEDGTTIRARLPLANAFDYADVLASLTHGHAKHSLRSAGYAVCPEPRR